MSQYTVQVFVDQNSFMVGHVAVKLTDISGNSTVVGFYPEDNVTHSLSDALNGFLGYGDVRDDTKRLSDMEGKSAVIEITKAQYDAMMDYANQVSTDSTSTYFLGGDGLGLNCATFARNLLDAGNVPHPDIEVHPYEYLPYSVVEQRVLDGLLEFGKWLGEFIKPLDNAIDALFTAAQKFRIVSDPLTLDLDGDGLETTGTDAGILFDHNADGIKTGTGWVSADDGMLVLDRNGNGSIDTGQELFGDSTVKSNGQRALDGFDALADLDSNADGKISSADAQFATLRVWRDLNQDGISQGGELFTLASLGIASIGTAKTANSQTLANENQIAGLGTYTRSDGSTGTSGDMSGRVAAQQRGTRRPTPCGCHLAADTFHREFTGTLDTTAVAALPDMQACPERSRRGSGVWVLREAVNEEVFAVRKVG